MEDIILVGFGGHAKSVIDAIERGGKYRIAGFTEVKECGEYHGYPCLGADDKLAEIYSSGVKNAAICIGYMGIGGGGRMSICKYLKDIGYSLPIICDPSAVVSASAVIGEGTFVGKGAVLNAESRIGKMCIINTGAVVEHEAHVGDFSHISVGTVLCGQAYVGCCCFIGANAIVIQNVTIRDNVIVGAGSVVLKDVPAGHKVYGVVKQV